MLCNWDYPTSEALLQIQPFGFLEQNWPIDLLDLEPWNEMVWSPKHHKSQIRKLWTTSDHWAWQPSITCVESFVTFFLTSNLCLCLSNHYRLALVINGHDHSNSLICWWSTTCFSSVYNKRQFKNPVFFHLDRFQHPPTGTTSQNWIEKDHSEIMLSECKNAPQPETEPTQKFPYKASISNKNTFELLLLYRSNKILQHTLVPPSSWGLVCGGWEWQRVIDWENLFQNPSPYEVHACMNSPIPLVWNPSLNPLLWNPWNYWYEILESTDVKSLIHEYESWIDDDAFEEKKKIEREKEEETEEEEEEEEAPYPVLHHSIAQKLQPNSSRAICPPPPSLPPFFLPLLDAKPHMKLLLQLVTEMHIQHLVANKTKQAIQQLHK